MIAFVIGGALFVLAVLVWALSTKNSGATQSESSRGSNILALPPARALADRIFAEQDWEFVSRQTRVEIQGALLRERRNLALSWLRQIHSQATQLMRLHRQAARQNTELRPSVEIRLAASYMSFAFLEGLLYALICVRGPFRARKMAGHAAEAAERLWTVSRKILGDSDSAFSGKVNTALTNKSS
jgi:hypothetical protein